MITILNSNAHSKREIKKNVANTLHIISLMRLALIALCLVWNRFPNSERQRIRLTSCVGFEQNWNFVFGPLVSVVFISLKIQTMQFNYVLSVVSQPMFRRNISPPSLELKSNLRKNIAWITQQPQLYCSELHLATETAPFSKTLRHRGDVEVEVTRLLLVLSAREWTVSSHCEIMP
jgi:hypothetical protein